MSLFKPHDILKNYVLHKYSKYRRLLMNVFFQFCLTSIYNHTLSPMLFNLQIRHWFYLQTMSGEDEFHLLEIVTSFNTSSERLLVYRKCNMLFCHTMINKIYIGTCVRKCKLLPLESDNCSLTGEWEEYSFQSRTLQEKYEIIGRIGPYACIWRRGMDVPRTFSNRRHPKDVLFEQLHL